jgi:hypothetical protein
MAESNPTQCWSTANRNLLFVNNVLRGKLKDLKVDASEVDLPVECDANIASKRVAEIVCGVREVEALADEQVRLMKEVADSAQIKRWKYFRDLDPSTEYDLLGETLLMVEQYKGKMDFEMNINKSDWWLGPLKAVNDD